MLLEFPDDFDMSNLHDFVAEHDHRIIFDENGFRVTPINGRKKEVITYDLHETARLLETGPNLLNKLLSSLKIIDSSRYPYPRYVEMGYIKIKPSSYTHHDTGQHCIRHKLLFTAKGIKWLKRKLTLQQKQQPQTVAQ